MTVVTPNGGESYTNPTGFNILWHVAGTDVDLSTSNVYLLSDGVLWVLEAGASVEANGNGFLHVTIDPGNWTDEHCYVQVTTVFANGDVISDQSDGEFTIVHRYKSNDEPNISDEKP